MKPSYRGILLLCLILFANLICTQYTVNMYFAEKYLASLLFAASNVILFPLALLIYKKESRRS